MKAKVIRKFFDRFNPSDIYGIGDVFEGEEARVAELVAGGWVEAIREEAQKKQAKKARKSK